MDREGRFWLGIWSLAAAVIVTFVCSIAYVNKAKNDQVVEMVKHGADPIKARCAIIGQADLGPNEKALCLGTAQVVLVQQPLWQLSNSHSNKQYLVVHSPSSTSFLFG